MCNHDFICSDYNTNICRNCGIETESPLIPSKGYTENMPLELGYSRYNRMNKLLNQLFSPKLYGTPNSRVVFEVIKHKFAHGNELLKWLSKLAVKNKRYQNAHFYYTIHDPTYKVPQPPSSRTMLAILGHFSKLEQRFECWSHKYKSFFSYNWLLRYFLKKFKLNTYIQFVKEIKCKKRVALYDTMYSFFMSSDNAVEGVGVSQTCQIQPCEPLGGGYSFPRGLLHVLSLSTKKNQSMKVSVT